MKLGSSWRKRSAALGALCALAGLLVLPSAVAAAPLSSQAFKQGPVAPRAQASIINGTAAAIADFPSLAYIAAQTGKTEGFACTGTVIAPRVILTAAHCVEDLDRGGFTPARDYGIATGQANPRLTPRDQILRVSETHVFPGFDPGTTHGDAALLVLSTPTAAPPIPLASAADAALYAGGTGVQLAGWGLTAPNAKSGPEVLQTTSTVVLDGASCKRRTRSFNPPYASALQMCTTDPPDHSSGGCFGDSGGPALAHRADGSLVEIGVTSTGGPGCSTKLPNVFTRVDTISAWAAEWVAAIETGAPPSSLKPRLPALSTESAEGFVGAVLKTELGNLFLRSRGLQGRCDRLGPPRVRCELAWVHGSKIYFASVTVFYVLENDAVGWNNSFVVQRVSRRCFESKHSGRCAFQTKRG
jgi:secreted trypsin-like serine protease